MAETFITGLSAPSGRALHVVHVIDNLSLGGAQRVLVNLTAGLAQRNWQQTVVILNGANTDPAILSRLHQYAQIVEFSKWQLISGLGLIRAFIQIFRADAVHTLLPYADVIGCVAALLAGRRPILSVLHGHCLQTSAPCRWASRITVHMVDEIGAVSHKRLKYAIRHEGVRHGRIQYMPNGISKPAPNAGKTHLLDLPGRRIIGSIGRLVPEKNYSLLINAITRVVRTHPNILLWIAGAGPLESRLRTKVQEADLSHHIRFLGLRYDIYSLLGQSELYVQSSRFEGMPLTVMEAMASGLPVVSTAVGGITDLIDDGVHGWLTKPNSVESLANAIIYALDNKAHCRSAGLRGQKRILTHFTEQTMVDRYDHVLRSICARRLPVIT